MEHTLTQDTMFTSVKVYDLQGRTFNRQIPANFHSCTFLLPGPYSGQGGGGGGALEFLNCFDLGMAHLCWSSFSEYSNF